MIKTVSGLILISAILLSSCSSLQIRKRNSVEEATNWNESKGPCPPGYQCLLKEKTKSALPLKLYKNKGTKNFNILHGDLINFVDNSDRKAGTWNLVLNNSQYGLGDVHFSDFDLDVDLVAQPQKSQPIYKAVGIDEHLQIISHFTYYYVDDDEAVTGYAVLDDLDPQPLFKLDLDIQGKTGDFYLNKKPLKRVSIGQLEMTFDEVDKYEGTIKMLKDGPFKDSLCLYKFSYQHQFGPAIDQFEVKLQCQSSDEGEGSEGGEGDGGETNQNNEQNGLVKVYEKLLLKNASKSSNKKAAVMKMVKVKQDYQKAEYALRAD